MAARRQVFTCKPDELQVRVATEQPCVRDLAQASEVYRRARDLSGEGYSTFRDGVVHDAAGKLVARISYNGKVWKPGKWRPGLTPIYNPYESE